MREEFKRNQYEILGSAWQEVWRDENFLSAIVDMNALVQEQVELDASAAAKLASLDTTPVKRVVKWRRLVLSESDMFLEPVLYGSGKIYGQGLFFGDPLRPETYTLPIEAGLDAPFLAEDPCAVGLMLADGVDYRQVGATLQFNFNPFDVWKRVSVTGEGSSETRTLECWVYMAGEDAEDLADTFGLYIGVMAPSTPQYKRLLRAAWALRVQGATLANVNEFLGALTGCDVCGEGGTVSSVWTEAGREYCAVGGVPYAGAPGMSAVVAEGDTVVSGSNLFDGFSVKTGQQIKNDADWPLVAVSRQSLGASYSGGLSFPNRTVAAAKTIIDGVTVPSFEMGGLPADRLLFLKGMASRAGTSDLYAELEDAGLIVAGKINPTELLLSDGLVYNSLFVRVGSVYLSSMGLEWAFRALRNAIPASVVLCAVLDAETGLEDSFDTQTDASETMEPFLCAPEAETFPGDYIEDGNSTILKKVPV